MSPALGADRQLDRQVGESLVIAPCDRLAASRVSLELVELDESIAAAMSVMRKL